MSDRPRLLVVDDEEAILETMTFTFEDDYEVLTSSSAVKALEMLEAEGPVAVVLSDQRMPEMTGVEFLAEVYRRHPETVRIILTGFADMDAIIHAINDGQVYAYITKPWEPDQLRQVIARAVERYALTLENENLLTELRDANQFLEAVMDHLGTGALAIDAQGVLRAINKPARDYLGLSEDVRGRAVDEVVPEELLEKLRAAEPAEDAEDGGYVEVAIGGGPNGAGPHKKLRVHSHSIERPDGGGLLGGVVITKEISHEPLRRTFDEIVTGLVDAGEETDRKALSQVQQRIGEVQSEIRGAGVTSPGMGELLDQTARTLTAIENWIAVDDALASEQFPDAQILVERMRVAGERWPLAERVPDRVRELARRVEGYYESGENPKQAVL